LFINNNNLHSMSEPSTLRRIASGDVWSIVAPQRGCRPGSLVSSGGEPVRNCDFCEGNEPSTRPEVFALRGTGSRPDAPGWRVRVVPNKYPALQAHAPNSPAFTMPGPFRQIGARGLHEVIIESPDHNGRFGAFDIEHLAKVLSVYRSRLQALSGEVRVKSVALFRNEGPGAGASLEHPHAQVLALPVVSSRQAAEVHLAVRHFTRYGACVTCQMVERECQDGGRLVGQDSDFAALTAFAPRFAYETWVVPKSHGHDFATVSDRQLRNLAWMLKDVLLLLQSTLGAFPFNLVVQTAPVRARGAVQSSYHWRIEIVPRLTIPSGFELGSGVFIVPVSPEQAARTLRASRSSIQPKVLTTPGERLVVD
jgi:UDPglucose--hexose-1-phosphate uridylyltransferase